MSNQKYRPSDEMIQEAFPFAKYDYQPTQESIERKEFAEKFFNQQCGSLHLNWSIDAYWKMVADRVMIPYVIAIYDALKERGYDENNKLLEESTFTYNNTEQLIKFQVKNLGIASECPDGGNFEDIYTYSSLQLIEKIQHYYENTLCQLRFIYK